MSRIWLLDPVAEAALRAEFERKRAVRQAKYEAANEALRLRVERKEAKAAVRSTLTLDELLSGAISAALRGEPIDVLRPRKRPLPRCRRCKHGATPAELRSWGRRRNGWLKQTCPRCDQAALSEHRCTACGASPEGRPDWGKGKTGQLHRLCPDCTKKRQAKIDTYSCAQCGNTKSQVPDWGRYENGRLKRLCPVCDSANGEAKLRNKAAQALGYAAYSNTPEYGRLAREREAAAAGRPLSPYVSTVDRAKAALYKRADMLAARRARMFYSGMIATWAMNPETQSMLRETTREERRLAFRRRYAENPEPERARSTANKHARPELRARADARRARRQEIRSDGSLTVEAVRRLFGVAKKCAYCLHDFSSSRKTLDHIEPLCLGGSHSLRNVVICCSTCNLRKGKKPFREWLQCLETKHMKRALALYIKRFGVPPEQEYLRIEWAAA